HIGPITKFTLDIPDLITCPNIDHLIYFLSRNGIQHLVFKPPFRSKPYELPSAYFTCSQLSIISRCPLLEHLVVQHNAITNHIEISAPKLRSFIFTGNIKFLHLKNVPLLSKVPYEPTEF
uniref:Uncharacterized protein n=1 Tax=Solanum lycopersicum TaxID=4081 RepID=A0A3Q7G360_SOLLC